MSKKSTLDKETVGLGGFIGGLGTLLDKLGALAEKGGELSKSGTLAGLDPEGKLRGVYGFSIRTGLGKESGLTVEPFGNVRADDRTGQPVVHEVREPMVDVFEEESDILVIAEMPGVGAEDVHLELDGDILRITAEKGAKKYRKEVLLPDDCGAGVPSHTCRNGVLEIRVQRKSGKE